MQDNKEEQTWQSLAFIWIGSMISVPGLLLGGTLIAGMSFWTAILTALVGYGVIVIGMIFQGIQSSDLRKPTVQVASQVFGEQGAQKIIAIILAISCLGWFGLQANVAGVAFSQFLALYDIGLPVWISSLFWGIVMLLSAIFGIKLLSWLNYIAVPFLLVVILYAIVISVTGGGWTAIVNYQPETHMPFLTGVSVTIGSFALGAIIAGDYSQYVRKRSGVAKASIIGVLPAGILMIASGAIFGVTSETADIISVFTQLGLPVIGVIAMLLATWTTNAVNAFSGGIAIVNVFNVAKEKQTIAVAAAGGMGTILAAIGILDYFVPIMNVLSAMIPPVAGVMIASYWIIQKGNPASWYEIPKIHWLGVISWFIGAAVAALPVILEFFPNAPQLLNQPLIGVVISFVIYYAGYQFIEKKAVKRNLDD
ncbi:cytosine permease [Tetragenococcus halophilus]|uniref:cytosine permease n=1 Tax=Tetragenococcus halophilus TaxID=51669 RepID=UPI000CB7E4BE|nr:cytosine permease [Tetragenococcus halophilus]MCO8284442.1 cytosine permease [Tetragenococcus halophilus]GBD65499.1 putative transporter [Tetragenococcus halophilus subsp. halophilus]GBD77501.1 putative transporter [Tetragenococcus halophilus subsp. halophilus]GMG66328.1 cytosine permease [Tetragenococcus halophilus]GMG69916.1 cytosine permease [Tetragenococcus halophilus]